MDDAKTWLMHNHGDHPLATPDLYGGHCLVCCVKSRNTQQLCALFTIQENKALIIPIDAPGFAGIGVTTNAR